MDWLHTHSPVKMDCRLGQLTVIDQSKRIQLVAYSSPATLHLCEQDISVSKELHHGNQVFLANLSCLESFPSTQQ
jgi:hypothetical protein